MTDATTPPLRDLVQKPWRVFLEQFEALRARGCLPSRSCRTQMMRAGQVNALLDDAARRDGARGLEASQPPLFRNFMVVLSF
jgi:hypothetical protein